METKKLSRAAGFLLLLLSKCAAGYNEAPAGQMVGRESVALSGQLQLSTTQLGSATCTGWRAFEGDKRFTPAFPDKASRYDNLAFTVPSGNYIALRMTGIFPHARYFSFNLYNFATAAAVKAVADYEIKPDAGSVNPYLPGAYRGAANRSYTIYFVKQGTALNLPAGSNVVEIPGTVDRASIITRVYRPDDGYDNLGGAAQPAIEALAVENAACPDTGINLTDVQTLAPLLIFNDALIQTWDRIRTYQTHRSDALDFFHFDGSGYLPNEHNKYVLLPLPSGVALDNVAVLKFKVPTFENSANSQGYFGGQTQTRYWSFCIGDLSTTGTPECVNDEYFKTDKNGIATLVVADITMKPAIEAAGFTFLRWGVSYKPILIFRHMLDRPDFSGRISLVPELPMPTGLSFSDADLDAKRAQNFIGNSAPSGSVMGKAEFLLKLALHKL